MRRDNHNHENMSEPKGEKMVRKEIKEKGG